MFYFKITNTFDEALSSGRRLDPDVRLPVLIKKEKNFIVMLQSKSNQHIYFGSGVVFKNKRSWVLTAGHCTAVQIGGQPNYVDLIRVAIPHISNYNTITERYGREKKKTDRFQFLMVHKQNIFNYSEYIKAGKLV